MAIKVTLADGSVEVFEDGFISEGVNGGELNILDNSGKGRTYKAAEWTSFSLTSDELLPELVEGADQVFDRHFDA